MTVRCPGRRADIAFDRPYPYHAGFGTQGFLYSEAGTLTLVWSIHDSGYRSVAAPWEAKADEQARLDAALTPSPAGDRWLFGERGAVPVVRAELRRSIRNDIDCLIYPDSVLTEERPGGFANVLRRDYEPSQ